MYVELERARSMLARGVSWLSAPDAAARRQAIAASKAAVGRCGIFIGQLGVQLHGGIGMTEEYAVGHYLKRLMVLDMLFGASDHHQARYAIEMDARSLG